MKILFSLIALLPTLALADVEFTGGAGVEQRYFFQNALYPQQERANLSAYFSPELYTSFNSGSDSLLFKGFYRFDQQDEERTHGDIRELKWTHSGEEWEVQTGISKVFWGQTESLHLVDIINQTDGVEAFDGEDKLGQPMVAFSLFKEWGDTTFFVLPYFRERTFAGADGRLRGELAIDTDNPIFESEDEEKNLDWAIRWQHTLGDWEVGLSYFDGTSREPDFVLAMNEQLEPSLRPFYPQLQQAGIDILALIGGWTIKFEGVQRKVMEQDYSAFVGGFEYSFVGLFDSVYDINWLMEYQYDNRDDLTKVAAQNDLMLGSRLVFNDVDGTEILLGMVQDLDYSKVRSGFIEASSRINDHWKWRVDAWLFSSDEPTEPTYMFRRDDYVQLSVEYYF
ncbi:hypothetical protein [uncultured Paraglaciecola sp.]|uniref:hypothetical protein n=1 Tax=uncultured Paraglaciecola sp. TaxID=1765024 RepID=UPI002628982B|nr:hypothetical protein [uncultured Paraglaciecola sp.]